MNTSRNYYIVVLEHLCDKKNHLFSVCMFVFTELYEVVQIWEFNWGYTCLIISVHFMDRFRSFGVYIRKFFSLGDTGIFPPIGLILGVNYPMGRKGKQLYA